MSYTEKAHHCVACGKEFDRQSDVVFCPDCGAPHHRACWQAEGHCHYEAAHGTDLEWHPRDPEPQNNPEPRRVFDPERENDAVRCPHCGRLTVDEDHTGTCPHCGGSLDHAESAPIMAGAPPEASSEEPLDGTTVGKLTRIVMHRWQYYIPRFREMRKQGSRLVSWNWAAFLLAPYWLAFRKCYLWSVFAASFDLVAMLLMHPMSSRLMTAVDLNAATYADAVESMLSGASFPAGVMLLAQLALLLLALRAVAFGLFGNYIYKRECLKRVERLDELPADEAMVRTFRMGGVNIFAPLLVYYAVSIAQSLLTGLI